MKNSNTVMQAKALWGAACFPFYENARQAYEWDHFLQIGQSIRNWIMHHSCGVLDGDNGVGKTYLVSHLMGQLDDKLYRCVSLSHSTLQAAGLVRQLCRRLGIEPRMARGDNLDRIHQHCDELKATGVWPVLFIDESQNLSAQSFEELRLINSHRSAGELSFSLLFVGDRNLMPRLKMGVNYALLARLSFYHQLQPLSGEQTLQYIQSRLSEAMIHQNPFEQGALELIANISSGKPRIINLLCRAALQKACEQSSSHITTGMLQACVESLPWIHQMPS